MQKSIEPYRGQGLMSALLPMKIERATEQGIQVLSVEFVVDRDDPDDFERISMILQEKCSTTNHLILEMSRVNFLNSVILRAIIRCSMILQENNARLVVAGFNSKLSHIFRVTGMDRIIPMRLDAAQAAEALLREGATKEILIAGNPSQDEFVACERARAAKGTAQS